MPSSKFIHFSLLLLLTAACGGPVDDADAPSTGSETSLQSNNSSQGSGDDSTSDEAVDGEDDVAGNGKTGTNGEPGNAAPNGTPNNGVTNNSQRNNAQANGEPGPEGLRLTSFHESVFVEEGCTSGYCHGTFELDSPERVVDAFVDVDAPQPLCGRTRYVVPGNPEESILWVRVRPLTDEDVECGVVKMPNGSEVGLDEEKAQLVYDWISDGALL